MSILFFVANAARKEERKVGRKQKRRETRTDGRNKGTIKMQKSLNKCWQPDGRLGETCRKKKRDNRVNVQVAPSHLTLPQFDFWHWPFGRSPNKNRNRAFGRRGKEETDNKCLPGFRLRTKMPFQLFHFLSLAASPHKRPFILFAFHVGCGEVRWQKRVEHVIASQTYVGQCLYKFIQVQGVSSLGTCRDACASFVVHFAGLRAFQMFWGWSCFGYELPNITPTLFYYLRC